MLHFIQTSLAMLDADLHKIEASLNRLSSEQLWQRPRDSVNSVGNLCLHLAGAEYQRMSTAIGGNELIRQRSLEFAANGDASAEHLLSRLKEVRSASRTVLQALTAEDLDRPVVVPFHPHDWQRMLSHQQDYAPDPAYQPETIARIIMGVVSHYAYHTGQIVYAAKLLQESSEHILKWKH